MRNYGDQDVGVGEVFVECAETTGFPGFVFSRQGRQPRLARAKDGARRKMQVAESEDGGLVYTGWV